jgi:NADH-quinone oxidoreductase subunit N
MIFAGIGFKLTIVPFHMWAADVYQGAPTPVTAYLSVASKGAGLAFMFQILFRIFGIHLADWTMIIAIFAAATMTLGNLVAIVQQNIKRFMAFSAISQAGYLVMGFLGAAPEGVPAMLFYMLVYLLTKACTGWWQWRR